MPLQTTFSHLFNLLPILKSCVTKEKSLAALFNAKQVTATLETTVKIEKSGLSLFLFFFLIFIFILIYFPFLFLELRVRVKTHEHKKKGMKE